MYWVFLGCSLHNFGIGKRQGMHRRRNPVQAHETQTLHSWWILQGGIVVVNECVIYSSIFFFPILVFMIENEIFKTKACNCNLQRSVTPLVKPHNFMHPDDTLVLEDDSGRVKLSGSVLLPSIYVTGLYNEKYTILI